MCDDWSFTTAPKYTERSDVHSESHLLSSPGCSCLLFRDFPNRPLSACSHPLKVCLSPRAGVLSQTREGRARYKDGRNGQSKDARRAGPHGPHVDMGLTTHMRVEHQKLHVLKKACEIRVAAWERWQLGCPSLSRWTGSESACNSVVFFTAGTAGACLSLRKTCIRLEGVRHTVSRVTFACLSKVVERFCQPLFELFSLGSPLGSGRNLLVHVSLVTCSQRSICHA